MTKKPLRGRPPVFVGPVKAYIVRLLKKVNNITHVRKILIAKKGTKWYAQRDLDIVPKPLSISVPTLRKFAEEAAIEFALGRPAEKQAA